MLGNPARQVTPSSTPTCKTACAGLPVSIVVKDGNKQMLAECQKVLSQCLIKRLAPSWDRSLLHSSYLCQAPSSFWEAASEPQPAPKAEPWLPNPVATPPHLKAEHFTTHCIQEEAVIAAAGKLCHQEALQYKHGPRQGLYLHENSLRALCHCCLNCRLRPENRYLPPCVISLQTPLPHLTRMPSKGIRHLSFLF